MKASVLHEYGGANKLRYEDLPAPEPSSGELRVRVLAVSVNPVDWKMRTGAAHEIFPVSFPGVLGRDVAGVVERLGEGVKGFELGDSVFAVAQKTYAELCVVKADDLAHMPEGLDMVTAGTVPLVALTGDQLIREAVEAQEGQTILLTGALGSVGRCALFCAREMGVKVIAGVRKKQMEEARSLGAVAAVDLDSDEDLARLGFLDAVADTVGGKLAPHLLRKVKPGGTYGSTAGKVSDTELNPLIRMKPMMAHPHPPTLVHYGEAIRDGRLKLPIESTMSLADAGKAQTLAEKGGIGKIVLVP